MSGAVREGGGGDGDALAAEPDGGGEAIEEAIEGDEVGEAEAEPFEASTARERSLYIFRRSSDMVAEVGAASVHPPTVRARISVP